MGGCVKSTTHVSQPHSIQPEQEQAQRMHPNQVNIQQQQINPPPPMDNQQQPIPLQAAASIQALPPNPQDQLAQMSTNIRENNDNVSQNNLLDPNPNPVLYEEYKLNHQNDQEFEKQYALNQHYFLQDQIQNNDEHFGIADIPYEGQYFYNQNYNKNPYQQQNGQYDNNYYPPIEMDYYSSQIISKIPDHNEQIMADSQLDMQAMIDIYKQVLTPINIQTFYKASMELKKLPFLNQDIPTKIFQTLSDISGQFIGQVIQQSRQSLALINVRDVLGDFNNLPQSICNFITDEVEVLNTSYFYEITNLNPNDQKNFEISTNFLELSKSTIAYLQTCQICSFDSLLRCNKNISDMNMQEIIEKGKNKAKINQNQWEQGLYLVLENQLDQIMQQVQGQLQENIQKMYLKLITQIQHEILTFDNLCGKLSPFQQQEIPKRKQILQQLFTYRLAIIKKNSIDEQIDNLSLNLEQMIHSYLNDIKQSCEQQQLEEQQQNLRQQQQQQIQNQPQIATFTNVDCWFGKTLFYQSLIYQINKSSEYFSSLNFILLEYSILARNIPISQTQQDQVNTFLNQIKSQKILGNSKLFVVSSKPNFIVLMAQVIYSNSFNLADFYDNNNNKAITFLCLVINEMQSIVSNFERTITHDGQIYKDFLDADLSIGTPYSTELYQIKPSELKEDIVYVRVASKDGDIQSLTFRSVRNQVITIELKQSPNEEQNILKLAFLTGQKNKAILIALYLQDKQYYEKQVLIQQPLQLVNRQQSKITFQSFLDYQQNLQHFLTSLMSLSQEVNKSDEQTFKQIEIIEKQSNQPQEFLNICQELQENRQRSVSKIFAVVDDQRLPKQIIMKFDKKIMYGSLFQQYVSPQYNGIMEKYKVTRVNVNQSSGESFCFDLFLKKIFDSLQNKIQIVYLALANAFKTESEIPETISGEQLIQRMTNALANHFDNKFNLGEIEDDKSLENNQIEKDQENLKQQGLLQNKENGKLSNENKNENGDQKQPGDQNTHNNQGKSNNEDNQRIQNNEKKSEQQRKYESELNDCNVYYNEEEESKASVIPNPIEYRVGFLLKADQGHHQKSYLEGQGPKRTQRVIKITNKQINSQKEQVNKVGEFKEGDINELDSNIKTENNNGVLNDNGEGLILIEDLSYGDKASKDATNQSIQQKKSLAELNKKN